MNNKKIGIFIRSLLGIGIMIIFAEAALTLYYKCKNEPDYNSKFVILPEYQSPYIYKCTPDSETANKTGKIHINNFSMRRTTDITETPKDKTIRILSYGDSIGWGFEAGDDQHYPYLLEQLLNQHSSKQYEVLNATRGYSPSIYVMHLKRDIIQFKPHKVIMEIELTNDVSDETMIKYGKLDRYNLPRAIKKARYWPNWEHLPPVSVNRHFWKKTKIYTFLTRRYLVLTRKLGYLLNSINPNPVFSSSSEQYYYNLGFDKHFLTERRLSEAFERMFRTIKAAQKFCDKNEVEFLLTILPSKYIFYPNQYQKGSIRLLEKAEARAKELDITYLCLRKAFQENGGSTLFMDFCHPTPIGYQVIAQELYKYYTFKKGI